MLLIGVPAFATDGNPLGHLNNAKNAIDQAQAALDQAENEILEAQGDLSSTTTTTSPPASSSTTTTTTLPATTTTTTVPGPVLDPGPNSEGSVGSFRVSCKLSHRVQADPIVAPGQTSAHMHDFFGNRSTNANSTYETMTAPTAITSCAAPSDISGYWAPTLISPSGTQVNPISALFYYRNRPEDYGTTKPFPPDIRIVAPATFPHSYWTCEGQSDNAYTYRTSEPIDCGTRNIKAHLFFPPCWDGKNLDSADHFSHMAYGLDNGVLEGTYPSTCPASHPIKLPQLDFRVLYPVTNGTGYVFSNGMPLIHADFWNTWRQSALEQQVVTCLNNPQSCGEFKG